MSLTPKRPFQFTLGKPGIGKSYIINYAYLVKHTAKSLGLPVVEVSVGQQNPSDLCGVPTLAVPQLKSIEF